MTTRKELVAALQLRAWFINEGFGVTRASRAGPHLTAGFQVPEVQNAAAEHRREISPAGGEAAPGQEASASAHAVGRSSPPWASCWCVQHNGCGQRDDD